MVRKRRKSRADKAIEGTMNIFGDLRKQGRTQSGLEDDPFGFKGRISKKKGKKQKFIDTPYGRIPV